MLQTGRALRHLGKRDLYRVLRWGPMAVADLVGEYFETELLRAVIAARGIFGTFLGPWSAGSALQLLIRAAGDSHQAGSAFFAAGGMGSLTQAMSSAAKAAGVEIRTSAEVIEIRVKDGAATGVLLGTGEEISAKAVISNADPKRTLLKLTIPHIFLPISYRSCNTTAATAPSQSQPRTLGPATFNALKNDDDAALKGRIHIGPNRLSRARFRRIQIRQLLTPALSRSHHSIVNRSHACARWQARDVDLHAVRSLQAER